IRADHGHLPNEANKKVLIIHQNLKRKVVESSVPIDAIVDQTYAGLQNSTVCQDVVIQLPSIATMRNNLQKERRKTRPPLPKNITELPHPILINYQKSLNGEQFVLYDGLINGPRCVIFSTPTDMLYLSQSEMWYCDVLHDFIKFILSMGIMMMVL
ncbi:unnamed protein product, partial [Didymodactylos carnosus]